MSKTAKPIQPRQESDRRPDGKFAPGNRANPRGRIPGSRNRATQIALELMEGQLKEITQTLVAAAVGGDMTAIKLVLERLVPPCKEKPLPTSNLPAVTGAADLPVITAAILNAVTAGQLTPGEGQSLTALVAAHGKAVEIAELEKRITALEQSKGK